MGRPRGSKNTNRRGDGQDSSLTPKKAWQIYCALSVTKRSIRRVCEIHEEDTGEAISPSTVQRWSLEGTASPGGVPWPAAVKKEDEEVTIRVARKFVARKVEANLDTAGKIEQILERATTIAHAALNDPRKDVSVADINRLLDTVVKAGDYVERMKRTAAGEKTAADLLPSMSDRELLHELAEFEDKAGETTDSDPLALPKVPLPPKPD